MGKKSKKTRKSGNTRSDAAVSSSGIKEDKFENAFAKFTIGSTKDTDEIDDATNPLRKSKVWNEPSYNKGGSIPTPLDLQQGQECGALQILEDTKTPLHIQVEMGNKFFCDPTRMYPMSSCPRGRVLIINNQEFDNPRMYSFRTGADVDADNLEKLFIQLGLNVTSLRNMKRNDMRKKIIDFADVADEKVGDMMVVCILSHGLEHGKIVCADGLVIDTEQDVLRSFNNDYCPALRGKPKFFIIQACRGEEIDCGVSSPTDFTDASPMGGSRGRNNSECQFRDVSWEDMLIAYSTLPGYVSNRNLYRGTWFIESICKVFMENAKNMNLRDMLDEVGFELSQYESENGTKQSCSYDVRHFYKKLYFNPGINIDPKERWKYSNSSAFDNIMSEQNKDETEGLQLATTSSKKRTISVSHFPGSK